MSEKIEIDSSTSLNLAIALAGYKHRIIATQPYDRRILCVEAGGNSTSLPPILVTAGVHADEPAGILAAFRLIEQLRTRRRVFVVPCRDPLGFDGLRRSLQLALGSEEPLGDWRHLQQVLLEHGQVLHSDEDIVIAIVDELAFTVFPPCRHAPATLGKHLGQLFKQNPSLIHQLKERRLLVPGGRLLFEAWDPFGPAGATRLITSYGGISNLDGLFGVPCPPADVASLRAMIDELQPALTLDLHEGGVDGFYMFSHYPQSSLEVEIAQAMSAAVAAHGGKLTLPEELAEYWETYFGPDVQRLYTHEVANVLACTWFGRTLSGYSRKYGASLVTETGRDQPLSQRVELQVQAIVAAIDAFDDASQRQ